MLRRQIDSFFQRVLQILNGNLKTINGQSVVGSGNITVGGGGATWGGITGTLSAQTDLQTALNNKQDTLVSGTNLKSLNTNTLLGSGDLTIDKTFVGLSNVDNTSDLNKPISTSTQTALNAKQDSLVSGTNIKTINSNSLLGSGNLIVNPPIFTIELINYATSTFYCPFNLKIDSITNLVGSPTVTILRNGVIYTVGSNVTITQGSTIRVTVSVSSVINLNCTQI